MPEIDLLVIGYGNTLRCDDGAGIKAAEAVAALNLPGVSVITRHQLVPELAEPISQAHAVVFVDANAKAAADSPQFSEIQPEDSGQIFDHAANPRSLLGLTRRLFGLAPQAWT